MAPSGAVADPAPGGQALQRFAANPGGPVPRFLGSGLVYDVSWVLEEARPGTRPVTLSASLLEDVVGFLAGLPQGTGAQPADRLLAVLTSLMPEWVPAAEELTATIATELEGWPSVAAHGDFWRGNLLEREGRLSGVVDWDAFDPHGVPGGDLLHLVATEERLRTRTSMGAVYRSAPWLRTSFGSCSRHYYRALGLQPSPAQLTAVGTAWWAAQVAGDLRRRPQLSRNDSWVAANVTSVLAPPR